MKIGDVVVHIVEGLCRLAEITTVKIGDMNKDYYVFYTLHNNLKLMIPMDQIEGRVRAIMTKEQVQEVIQKMPTYETKWVLDSKDRKSIFQKVLSSGCTEDIGGVLYLLTNRSKELTQLNKSLNSSDKEVMRLAQRTLFSEIAYVLEIPPDEVISYINQCLKTV